MAHVALSPHAVAGPVGSQGRKATATPTKKKARSAMLIDRSHDGGSHPVVSSSHRENSSLALRVKNKNKKKTSIIWRERPPGSA